MEKSEKLVHSPGNFVTTFRFVYTSLCDSFSFSFSFLFFLSFLTTAIRFIRSNGL